LLASPLPYLVTTVSIMADGLTFRLHFTPARPASALLYYSTITTPREPTTLLYSTLPWISVLLRPDPHLSTFLHSAINAMDMTMMIFISRGDISTMQWRQETCDIDSLGKFRIKICSFCYVIRSRFELN
jgi:hypothetical protein